MEDNSLIFGLETCSRSLCAVTADTEKVRFLATSQAPTGNHSINLLNYDDDDNQIQRQMFKTKNENWKISSCPQDAKRWQKHWAKKQQVVLMPIFLGLWLCQMRLQKAKKDINRRGRRIYLMCRSTWMSWMMVSKLTLSQCSPLHRITSWMRFGGQMNHQIPHCYSYRLVWKSMEKYQITICSIKELFLWWRDPMGR